MTHLPPLIDNSDDWRSLRDLKHAADDILKLCETRNKVRFSEHLFSAILIDREIVALTDVHSDGSTTSGAIRRHLQLLRKNTT
uniref:Uncharacterized protein n=1 Tax=Hyaloperonospora arabidopsidis (strain Emoy2) TaxID=559515 RepID=M4BHS8_HYAAE